MRRKTVAVWSRNSRQTSGCRQTSTIAQIRLPHHSWVRWACSPEHVAGVAGCKRHLQAAASTRHARQVHARRRIDGHAQLRRWPQADPGLPAGNASAGIGTGNGLHRHCEPLRLQQRAGNGQLFASCCDAQPAEQEQLPWQPQCAIGIMPGTLHTPVQDRYSSATLTTSTPHLSSVADGSHAQSWAAVCCGTKPVVKTTDSAAARLAASCSAMTPGPTRACHASQAMLRHQRDVPLRCGRRHSAETGSPHQKG